MLADDDLLLESDDRAVDLELAQDFVCARRHQQGCIDSSSAVVDPLVITSARWHHGPPAPIPVHGYPGGQFQGHARGHIDRLQLAARDRNVLGHANWTVALVESL